MSQKSLRFALFGNEFQARKSVAILKVLDCLHAHGAEVYIDRAYYSLLTRQQHVGVPCTGVFDGYPYQEVDFAISLGGDGTFLRTANMVGAKETPIVGVNMGRLGFLADVLPTEAEAVLEDIYAGNYRVEDHTAIQIETEGEPVGGSPYALNDIAVLKRDEAAMISVRCAVNGQFLANYQADGLIVATPTGSTAYSLSNGGPIIVPSAHDLVITPVAPHSLNIRPIVISDDCVITLEVESRSHNFLVAMDGRSERMREGTRITIHKAPFRVRVVKQPSAHYFSTLRDKLMWGADQRG